MLDDEQGAGTFTPWRLWQDVCDDAQKEQITIAHLTAHHDGRARKLAAVTSADFGLVDVRSMYDLPAGPVELTVDFRRQGRNGTIRQTTVTLPRAREGAGADRSPSEAWSLAQQAHDAASSLLRQLQGLHTASTDFVMATAAQMQRQQQQHHETQSAMLREFMQAQTAATASMHSLTVEVLTGRLEAHKADAAARLDVEREHARLQVELAKARAAATAARAAPAAGDPFAGLPPYVKPAVEAMAKEAAGNPEKMRELLELAKEHGLVPDVSGKRDAQRAGFRLLDGLSRHHLGIPLLDDDESDYPDVGHDDETDEPDDENNES